jgi:predicted Zn-dependent protease
MRLIVILMALACAMPALAQGPADSNGPDTTNDQAAQLETQRHEYAATVQALRDGDFKAARKYAARLTNAQPKNLDVWLRLGEAETGLKDWSGAGRAYATAVRLKPSSPEAHAGYGIALARRGNADGAAKQLAWLTEKAQACGMNCGQLTKLRADVEAAIAAGAG